MPDIVKLGSKGEVRLPRSALTALGLKEGDDVVISVEDGAIVLRRKAERFASYLDRLAVTGRKRDGR